MRTVETSIRVDDEVAPPYRVTGYTKRHDRGSTTYPDPGCQVSSFTDVCRLERVQMFSIRITLYGNGPYGKTGGQAADMTRCE